ncbi:MAG: radical SAM protein [Deltaproteobacteria bacterium]|nr:radical SAM protein [Deltaproteobacteria bacterium]
MTANRLHHPSIVAAARKEKRVLEQRLKYWTRMITLPLLQEDQKPVRVQSWAEHGLRLALFGLDEEPLRLRFFLLPGQDRNRAGMELQHSPQDGIQKSWLTRIEAAAKGLEENEDWIGFLLDSGGLRCSSGDAFSLRMTRRCNAACSFCNARGQLHDLAEESDVRERMLAEAARQGSELVSFTGGEPTLEPELAYWIERAKTLGFSRVELQTNGVALAEPGLLASLMEAGLDHILLSLHAGTKTLHDDMLKLPGAFEAVTRAMELARSQKLDVTVNCVILRENLQALGGLLERMHEWKLERLMLSYVSPDAVSEAELNKIPRIREVAQVMTEAIHRGSELGITVRIPGLCGLPICTLDASLMSHFDEAIDERPPPRIPSRRYGQSCKDCSLQSRCSGFWTLYLDRFGDTELSPR